MRASSALKRLDGGIGSRLEIYFAAACSNLLSLALPIVILQVYDRVIPNNSFSTLALLLIGLAVVLVLDALLNLLRSHLSAWRGARIQHILNCSGVEHILESDLKAFEADGPGVQLHRLNGIETLSAFHAGQEMQLRIDLPFAILFVGLIAAVSVELAAVLLAVISLLAVAGSVSGYYLRRALEDRSQSDDLRHNFVIELLRGIHTIKLIGAEALMGRRHERLQATAAQSNYWVVFHSTVARVVGTCFSQLVILSVAAYGGSMAMTGQISIGGLAACIFLAGRTAQPLLRAMGIWTRFQSFRIARDQLEAIFALPAQPRGRIEDGEAIRGHVDIENISFGYRDEAPPLLDGISLSLAPGEVVGITGNNGSGKTTLLRLITGILRPGAGCVRLDGNTVSDYDRDLLHRHVVYLPQNAVLFQGSILDNITLFNLERAGRAKRIAAMLGLSEIIGSLPRGYDTEIRDNPEESLPTGISQRIAIVRALASVEAPRLIIFDESNSHLDAEGDEALRQMLVQLRGHCTMILVSHRPSYLSLADRIFVLREGRLTVGSGGARAVLAELERQLDPPAVMAAPVSSPEQAPEAPNGPEAAPEAAALGQRAS